MINHIDPNFDFLDIAYLKSGNDKQRHAYDVLIESEIFTILHQFDPILVGTIPINIDIDLSDLDIICCYRNKNMFKDIVGTSFSNKKDFHLRELDGSRNAIVANFSIDTFAIELFAQSIVTREQYAYRHMIAEHKLLCKHGELLRQKVISLKHQGYKTEPAFAVALGIEGDPYIELLSFENLNTFQ